MPRPWGRKKQSVMSGNGGYNVAMPSDNSKVALVTGSGKRRVGWYVAEALAQRGFAVAVHYRTSAADAVETVAHLKALGVEAQSFQADLGDERAVGAMVRDVLQRF